ncbi:MAG: dihydrofolate reductase family protein [Anaerolineaceae bacterium]|nr:dihydrofolate reductase family protein [Anaerolineaceae bacterium]
MRKIILFNLITLDGFFAGPNGELDWHNVDDEFNEFAIDQLDSAGGLIFGRVTYQMMASYWPTPASIADDPVVAGKMNEIPKIVFSNTLDKADWSNTRLVKGHVVEEISKLKQQPGKDFYIFGSADLAATFIQNGLIDEYRIIVNPIVLGGGLPLFKDLKDRLNLKLIKTRTFHSGNVLLYYEPAT